MKYFLLIKNKNITWILSIAVQWCVTSYPNESQFLTEMKLYGATDWTLPAVQQFPLYRATFQRKSNNNNIIFHNSYNYKDIIRSFHLITTIFFLFRFYNQSFEL